MRRVRATVGLAALATVAAIAGSAASGKSPSTPAGPSPIAGSGLPAAVEPAFVPGAARPLRRRAGVSRWATVKRAVTARAAPDPAARVVARLGTITPEGTDNAVSVVGRRRGADGEPWVRARLPALPTGVVGWIPRSALGGYHVVHTRLDVDLAARTLTLSRAGRRILRVPVAVGMPGWETPRGTFFIRNKLTRYQSAAYGPVAFGTSARSEKATDWPAGGFVGIHGTDRPDLVPGRVSHGCIRLRNQDVLALARVLPVGTPVRIH